MKSNQNFYSSILRVLKDLRKKYPNIPLTQHLEGAMKDTSDFLSLTDRSFFLSLKEYEALLSLELDQSKGSDYDIDKIIEDGSKIGTSSFFLYDESEDEEFYNEDF